jgi:hypothetical protein
MEKISSKEFTHMKLSDDDEEEGLFTTNDKPKDNEEEDIDIYDVEFESKSSLGSFKKKKISNNISKLPPTQKKASLPFIDVDVSRDLAYLVGYEFSISRYQRS